MTAVRRGHLSCSLIKYHIYNKSGRICVRRRTEKWLHLLTDVCAGGLWSLQTALRLLNQKLLATVAIVIFYVCLCRGPRHPLQTGLRLSSGEQTRHDPGESLSFFFLFGGKTTELVHAGVSLSSFPVWLWAGRQILRGWGFRKMPIHSHRETTSCGNEPFYTEQL